MIDLKLICSNLKLSSINLIQAKSINIRVVHVEIV